MPLKYFGEKTTDSGSLLRVEIHQAGFAGAATSVRLMESGADVLPSGPGTEHVYEALLPTTAQVYLWDPDGVIDDEIASAQADEYTVIVIDSSVSEPSVFTGRAIPSPDKRSLNVFPETATILARCTLADLKDIPFVDDAGDFFTGRMSIKDIVCKVLAKTGLGLNVLFGSMWHVPEASGLVDPLASYFLDMAAFRTQDGFPVNCEDVLNDMATEFHLQVRQSLGEWHCYQRECLFAGTFRRFRYTSAGVYVGEGVYDPAVVVSEAVAGPLRRETDRQPRILAYKGVTVTFEHGPVPSLIRNGTFSQNSREDGRAPYPPRRPGRGSDPGPPFRRHEPRRGGIGRDFGGQYNAPTPQEQKKEYWLDEAGGTNITIANKVGPDGSNVAVLTPAYTTGGSDFANVTKWYWQEGLRFAGGPGVRVRWDLHTFLKMGAQWRREQPWLGPYVVYYRVVLSDGVTDQYWLDADGSWKTVVTNIIFGDKAWTRRGGGASVIGIGPEEWFQFDDTSDEVPEGLWTPKIYLYQAIDNTPGGGNTIEKHYWAKVEFAYIKDDVIAPAAQNVTALDPASTNKLTRTVPVRFGDAPVADMLSALTLSDGSPTGNWKVGPYGVGEPGSGKSHAQILAEALFLEQAENIEIHEAGYLREFPRVWPHQVLELAGVRYQVGEQTYPMARSRQGGQFVRLQQYGTAPTINLLSEEGTFNSLGRAGAESATRYIQFSQFAANFATLNPICVTMEVIDPVAPLPGEIRLPNDHSLNSENECL